MKNIDRQRLLQIIFTMLGIMFVSALFYLAVTFPDYYSLLYDKNTLNKVNYTDIEINTYEASYETFLEKIRPLALAYTKQEEIRALRISEPENQMDRKEITVIARRELDAIRDNGMMGELMAEKITLKQKKLSVCERYTIYKTQNTEQLQGISFWKLVYKNAKKTITLYIDEEFHKIYYLDIKFRRKKYEKEKPVYDANMTSFGGREMHAQYFYQWFEGIRHYYGIDSYELQNTTHPVSSWTVVENLQSIIEFDGTYSIPLFEGWGYDRNGNRHWYMGVPIEKMIQF